MFHRILAWVFGLLQKIWIREPVIPAPIIEVVEETTQLDQPIGDDTLELINYIIAFKDQRFTLSNDAFDKVLYKSISTQVDNHSWYVKALTLLTNLTQEQLEDSDESVYLDDPMFKGLSRGVPTDKELGKFLSEGKVRNIHDAFYDLLAKTRELHYMYVKLQTHPVLRDIQKDYFRRQMYRPMELVKMYMDSLYLHGKLDDSEKEANCTQQNVGSTGQKNQ